MRLGCVLSSVPRTAFGPAEREDSYGDIATWGQKRERGAIPTTQGVVSRNPVADGGCSLCSLKAEMCKVFHLNAVAPFQIGFERGPLARQ
jgi:hypothetical protein